MDEFHVSGTTDSTLADSILCKVKTQIVEGRFFEVREERDRTFEELMERYTQERSSGKATKSAV